MKAKRTLSLSHDTQMRLVKIAELRHSTVSQLITDWTWSTRLPGEDPESAYVDGVRSMRNANSNVKKEWR